MDELQHEIGGWGAQTFPHATDVTVCIHLLREAEELLSVARTSMRHTGAAVDDFRHEAADCLLLLFHLAHRVGFSLEDACREKFEVNKARQWGVPDSDGVMEHIREKKQP